MATATLLPPTPRVPATFFTLARLQRNMKAPPAVVEAAQLARLEDVLAAARRSPFWSDHLGPARSPRSLTDLTAFPTVDKGALRATSEEDRLTGPQPAGTRTLLTSGSTGEPFRVVHPPVMTWMQGVLKLRRLLAQRVPPWRRVAVMRPFADPLPGRHALSRMQHSRRVALPVHVDVDELAERVLEARPGAVAGYPHFLVELGEALRGRAEVRAVLTHGETLTAENRAALRELFGRDPIDGYGTAECGAVAWQCRARDLYHVDHEAVIVEILDGDGRRCPPGETGDVVLTSLTNELMPFVRYRIGDAAAWATRPCRCGYELPALVGISGRTFEWVVDSAGRAVVPQRMWVAMHLGSDRFDAVHRYRVTQFEDRRLLVEVVPSPTFTSDVPERLVASYRELLGDIPVEVAVVPELRVDPGTKFETVRSLARRDGARRHE